MSNSSIAGKLKGLEERLESEVRNRRENASFNNQGGFGTPRTGSGRRPKPFFSGDIPMFPPRSPHATETENRMREVYKVSGKLNVEGKEYRSHIDELQHLGELGSGTCGHVVKMLHKPSAAVIAVKQMRRSGNSEETKRILMDLDVVVRSHDCPYIVRCLGCFVTDADVWICMELMATCFDKLLKRLGAPIPEAILGKVTMATVNALSYLKDAHGVIHRDVKPSNILLDERGNVKLCDFGISGRLVDSKAKTRSAGCAAYMAPERIDPPDPTRPDYDIRADVWSLGISLVELATGVFPYRDCQNDFEVLTRVIEEDPPQLPDTDDFTPEFKSFVSQCLTKNYRQRPKYPKLLEHPFVVKSTRSIVSVGDWYATLPLPGQNTPTKPVVRTVATFNIGGASANGFGVNGNGGGASSSVDSGVDTSPGHFVTDAQHWIDQVTPQPQRAWWARGAGAGGAGAGSGAGGSSSQPASLEPVVDYDPHASRNLDGCMSPPPPARRFSVENRWRPSPASSGNTSPIVLQRFHHQSQQRRSRVDLNSTPRHRSVSREHSAGRSPEPPPRSGRPARRAHNVAVVANGSCELEVPAVLHERLHPPSPLLLNHNRVSEGRSQSVSRAELAPPAHSKLPHDDQGWLHSLAGLVKRRLSGYAKWHHHSQRPAKPAPQGKSRWGTSESWSVPASPLPPRGAPRAD